MVLTVKPKIVEKTIEVKKAVGKKKVLKKVSTVTASPIRTLKTTAINVPKQVTKPIQPKYTRILTAKPLVPRATLSVSPTTKKKKSKKKVVKKDDIFEGRLEKINGMNDDLYTVLGADDD